MEKYGLYVCVCVFIRRCLCTFASIQVFMYAYVYLCMYSGVCVYSNVYANILRLLAYLCIPTCVRVSVCFFEYVCAHLHLFAYSCMPTCICVCMYFCQFMCVYVCLYILWQRNIHMLLSTVKLRLKYNFKVFLIAFIKYVFICNFFPRFFTVLLHVD